MLRTYRRKGVKLVGMLGICITIIVPPGVNFKAYHEETIVYNYSTSIKNNSGSELLSSSKILEEKVLIKKEQKKEEMLKKEQEKKQGIITIHGYKYQMQPGELDLLKKVIYAEARGLSKEDQVASTEVILNRVVYNKKTISEIIRQKGQFSCVGSDGNVYTGLEPDLVRVTNELVTEEVSESVEKAVFSEEDITEQLLTNEAIAQGLDPEVYAKGGALYFFEKNTTAVKAKLKIRVKGDLTNNGHTYYRVWD